MKLLLVVIFFIVVAIIVGAATCHLVKTTDGFVLVGKKHFTFSHAYIDLTQWSIATFLSNLELTAHLYEKGVISKEIMARLRRFSLDEEFRKLEVFLKKRTG